MLWIKYRSNMKSWIIKKCIMLKRIHHIVGNKSNVQHSESKIKNKRECGAQGEIFRPFDMSTDLKHCLELNIVFWGNCIIWSAMLKLFQLLELDGCTEILESCHRCFDSVTSTFNKPWKCGFSLGSQQSSCVWGDLLLEFTCLLSILTNFSIMIYYIINNPAPTSVFLKFQTVYHF